MLSYPPDSTSAGIQFCHKFKDPMVSAKANNNQEIGLFGAENIHRGVTQADQIKRLRNK